MGILQWLCGSGTGSMGVPEKPLCHPNTCPKRLTLDVPHFPDPVSIPSWAKPVPSSAWGEGSTQQSAHGMLNLYVHLSKVLVCCQVRMIGQNCTLNIL
mmetsp:Transcript_84698/g.203062  ORF Transcript_84698/g.203062 Transcript_84698/m.203062 type:complete len:98 (-) Transcript_84698:695-988(-)